MRLALHADKIALQMGKGRGGESYKQVKRKVLTMRVTMLQVCEGLTY